ncbi:Ubiquitin carboxyl-terminal hydrolase isozyme L5 [Eumeta japonica]|uniref:Ubiquitin carboxyl-terminal hydrolase n=1 Tax=Eumeta variegata TaxID=151549 RepID=A0A4C1W9P1_EUMVA|nr:Ubiquitin carboxyl-terminal hydrolase isozyme L5 [Eumeta japonica]
MGSAGEWSLIESDPGVFTELTKRLGATGVQVEELWSLSENAFETLRPIHGLIFLFKWVQNEEPDGPIVQDDRIQRIYFAKQVINNACATQALINLLLNCNHPDLNLGSELSQLKEFSMSFDPKMRGLTISNSDTIRKAHNSVARQALFEFDGQITTTSDEVYHYVGYMPIDGRLYELDGLREGPIDLGPIPSDKDWLDIVRPVITKRMNRYTDGEIHFNLMAFVADKKMLLERQLQELIADSDLLGMNPSEVKAEIPRIKQLIEIEESKRRRYEKEMIRRRHNYLPFIVELLKILAEEKKLMPLYEKAKTRATEKSAKKMKV